VACAPSGSGAGSALLQSPEKIKAIVRAVRAATKLPLTVKIRSGWQSDSINFLLVGRIVQDEGADAVQQTINPATGEAEIWIRWHEVSSFHGSGPHSRHYTLDHGTGEVVFGDGSSGLLPPLGTNSIVANYRVGVGSAGNVLVERGQQPQPLFPQLECISVRIQIESALAGEIEIMQGLRSVCATAVMVYGLPSRSVLMT
jgi:hypothetical protein